MNYYVQNFKRYVTIRVTWELKKIEILTFLTLYFKLNFYILL